MKPRFALSGSLTNATQVGGVWGTAQLSMTVGDSEGVSLLSDVVVGDLVMLDTGAYDGGSVAIYRITTINSRAGTALVVTAAFNELGAAPDLSWCIGASAMVVRKGHQGSLPVVSPAVQGIPDKLPFTLLGESIKGLADPKAVTAVAFTGGKVTGMTIGSDAFVMTYGANGLTGITKNGSPFATVAYAGGVVSGITFA